MNTKKILISLFLILCIHSCVLGDSISIVGSKHVIKEIKELEKFTSIEYNGVINVILIQDQTHQVIIEADDNIIPYIIVKEEQGALKISMQKGVKFKKITKLNLYLHFEELSSIKMKGVGKLVNEGSLHFDQLKIAHKGVGSIELQGSAKDLYIANEGVGNVNTSKLIAENAEINNRGVGSVTVHATKTIKIDHSGVGTVRHTGGAEVLKSKSSGIGSEKEY